MFINRITIMTYPLVTDKYKTMKDQIITNCRNSQLPPTAFIILKMYINVVSIIVCS